MSNREVKQIDNLEKELFSEDERIEMWITRNWLKAAIVAVVLVIVSVSVYSFIVGKKEADVKKQKELANIQSEKLDAAVIEANKDVTGIGIHAIRLAEKLMGEKKYGEAVKILAPLQSDAKLAAEWRQKALLLQASALELDKKSAELLTLYRGAAGSADFSEGFKAQCDWQVARLLLAQNKQKEAVAILKRVVERQKALPDDPVFAMWAAQCRQTLVAVENGEFNKK